MAYKARYEEWLNNPFFDAQTHEELLSIKDNEAEIEDRFFQDLEFGTAGLRGKIGAGTNRMNVYNVARATQGFADLILTYGEEAAKRGVAIAYDVRHMSPEFAQVTAEVFAANGIHVYIYEEIQPTPVLSYTIRKLNAIAGVMVTASHNPKEYNGYKAYWEEGSQILEEAADAILENIGKIKDFAEVKQMTMEEGRAQGLIETVPAFVIDDYLQDVLGLTLNEDVNKDISIVFSPLNGTGNVLVQEILKRRGFTNVHIVKEQEMPDPDFTTAGYPNPEDPKAFAYSENLGKEVGAKILLATDPDADRCAMEVLGQDGEYQFFTGNMIGALLVEYILSQQKAQEILPDNGVIVKSIVTGDMTKAICEYYGVEMEETLTGFKNVCGRANVYEQTGEKTFIFGYEESIGYNYGTFVRDKDAVSSAMMISEMAAFYDKAGKSLIDVYQEMSEKYGFYENKVVSITLEGADGQALIKRIMDSVRKDPLESIGDLKLAKAVDYANDETGLQKSNVLQYTMDDRSWFALRPSGTEPKIKIYVNVRADSREKALEKLELIEETVRARMKEVK